MDYAATTPVDEAVAERMSQCLTRGGRFGNPASRSHIYGWEAEEWVEESRQQVAALIGADAREIVFTSGATEADNLAIKGAAQAGVDKGRHLVTSLIEHHAVLDSFRYLEQQGFEVSWLRPDSQGVVAPDQVAEVLRPDTSLVSLMHVNNEIGSINDIATIGQLCRDRGVIFHTDAAQSAGKIPLDVASMSLDLVSLSAHKVYGPKGAGALYVRRRPRMQLEPQMHGGGHERGLRSGTLATHQIVGMAEAFRIAGERMATDLERIKSLRERLLRGLSSLDGVAVNGHPEQSYPGILNLSFAGVDGEALLSGLRDIAVSSGSACTSASREPSYVLRAIGLSDDLAEASIRFSIGRLTQEHEIDLVIEKAVSVVQRLRRFTGGQTGLRQH